MLPSLLVPGQPQVQGSSRDTETKPATQLPPLGLGWMLWLQVTKVEFLLLFVILFILLLLLLIFPSTSNLQSWHHAFCRTDTPLAADLQGRACPFTAWPGAARRRTGARPRTKRIGIGLGAGRWGPGPGQGQTGLWHRGPSHRRRRRLSRGRRPLPGARPGRSSPPPAPSLPGHL